MSAIRVIAPPDFRFGGSIYSTIMFSSLNRPIEILAEGIYNTETGGLCMMSYWPLDSNRQKLAKNYSMDCEILINVQFSPLDSEIGGYIQGTIKGIREKADPLYFQSLQLASNAIYEIQAKVSLWIMHLEITMVLLSNTLACVFNGLQLFYVKKHPNVPFILLVMLVVLTLGHMIPLVLNFESLFLSNQNRQFPGIGNRQNVLLGSGGWLEVNEVIVRIVTMVAFLLQFRLLQLAWSTRWSDGSHKGLWVAEKKALYVTLLLYLIGGLITWFWHWRKKYYEAPMLHARFISGYQ